MLKLRKVNNWLQQASRLWTCSETRPRYPFGKPLITAGTGGWSLWSLLWLWSPAFPVSGPDQLPGGARYRLFQWPLEWRSDLRIVGCIVGLVDGGKTGWSSCFNGCVADVGVGIRVRDCDVPYQRLTPRPWQDRDAVGAFAVLPKQAHCFFNWRHVKWCRCDSNGVAVLGHFTDRPAHKALFHSRMCVVRTLCNPVCEQLTSWVAHLKVV